MSSTIKIQLTQKGIHFTTAKKNYIRLICPKCEKLQVKNWDDPEFYYHPGKHRGHCFRCDLKIKSEKEFLQLFNLRPLGFSLSLPEETKKPVLWPTPLPEGTVPAFQSKKALVYLRDRSMTKADIERFGIMFCREGWYAERLIIPVFNHRQTYCTFVSRTIESHIPATRKNTSSHQIAVYHIYFLTCVFSSIRALYGSLRGRLMRFIHSRIVLRHSASILVIIKSIYFVLKASHE